MRILLIACSLLTGCNLFASAPDASSDMGGLDGQVPDLRSGDAGVRDLNPSHEDLGDELDATRDLSSDLDTSSTDADSGDVNVNDAAVDMSDDMEVDMTPTDPCLWADTIFCSGFEDSALSLWDGTYEDTCGLTFETTIVRSGNGALKAEMLQGRGYCAAFKEPLSSPVDDDDEIWIRAWLYLPSTLQIDYFEWIGLRNDISDEEVNAGIWDDGLDGHFHLDSYDGYPQGNFTLPRDQWVCIEWNIRFDPQNGRSFVAVDGVARVDVAALQLALIEPLDRFDIGQVYSDTGQSGSVYFDDVFIGRSRPGCD